MTDLDQLDQLAKPVAQIRAERDAAHQRAATIAGAVYATASDTGPPPSAIVEPCEDPPDRPEPKVTIPLSLARALQARVPRFSGVGGLDAAVVAAIVGGSR